jgi:hypothetical protein
MMNTQRFVATAVALGLASLAHAQVGTLQGVVNGVQPGTVLPVFKGDAKVADLKVEAGGKYSLALNTGVYTVKCPNGTSPKIAALNGSATINVNCQ